jgi:hypothetical protein
MPFGVLEGALRLASWSPEALTRATSPSDPLTTAARAEAAGGAFAVEAGTRIPAAAATAASGARTRTFTPRVCQTVPSRGRASASFGRHER